MSNTDIAVLAIVTMTLLALSCIFFGGIVRTLKKLGGWMKQYPFDAIAIVLVTVLVCYRLLK
jgi:hypothetical protein